MTKSSSLVRWLNWPNLELPTSLYEKKSHFLLDIQSLVAKTIQIHMIFIGIVCFALEWVNILANGWSTWYFSFSSQLCCLILGEFLSQTSLWIKLIFQDRIGSSFGHCRSPICVWKQSHVSFWVPYVSHGGQGGPLELGDMPYSMARMGKASTWNRPTHSRSSLNIYWMKKKKVNWITMVALD